LSAILFVIFALSFVVNKRIY